MASTTPGLTNGVAQLTLLSPFPDRMEDQLPFTYVQGMNVLAAPFLYTMPSEIEAFYCFAKFIEEACPLYVQPTLEGVHKGLRVSSAIPDDVSSKHIAASRQVSQIR